MIFVVSPSGAGKSTLSEWIAADLQFLHIDIDQPKHFTSNHLWEEWKHFYSKSDPSSLVKVVHNHIIDSNRSGAVLSFPSNIIITHNRVKVARSVGILTVLLWGTKELCKEARRAREFIQGQTFNEKRYDISNKAAFDTYGSHDYDNVRVEAFRPDGSRWAREEIVRSISRLID